METFLDRSKLFWLLASSSSEDVDGGEFGLSRFALIVGVAMVSNLNFTNWGQQRHGLSPVACCQGLEGVYSHIGTPATRGQRSIDP